VLGLVFKTSVRHSVSPVGSTPTSFRHSNSNTVNNLQVPLISVYHPCIIDPMTSPAEHVTRPTTASRGDSTNFADYTGG
jgi:hypothetical protein